MKYILDLMTSFSRLLVPLKADPVIFSPVPELSRNRSKEVPSTLITHFLVVLVFEDAIGYAAPA